MPGSEGRAAQQCAVLTRPRSQPCLMRAEHGNPARVRAGQRGRPIVRGAQAPGGTGCPKKRMPAAERQRETRAVIPVLLPGARHNWPDTGPGARARKRADVGR
jgi:hypothetical protein